MTAPPVVVFDLDGTILETNSFPRWVVFLMFGRLPVLGPRRRMALSLRALSALLQRKLARGRHDEFLWRLQAAWQSVSRTRPDTSLARFEAALLRQVRPNMGAVLELVARGRIDAVLATAAAEDYAAGLGRRLGFRDVLATPAGRRRDEPANRGPRKREKVVALLRTRGWHQRPLILFTDHLDDLPLMHDSDAVYWCGPPDALSQAVAAAKTASFVFCGDLDSAEIAARLSAAYQPLSANTAV